MVEVFLRDLREIGEKMESSRSISAVPFCFLAEELLSCSCLSQYLGGAQEILKNSQPIEWIFIFKACCRIRSKVFLKSASWLPHSNNFL